MLHLVKSEFKNIHRGFFDYLLVFFLVITSGYLSVSPNSITLFIPIFIITLYLSVRRGIKFDKRFFLTFTCIAIIFIIQKILWGGNWNNIILPTFRFITLYMMAILLKESFIYLFTKIIVAICLISLFFWAFDLLIPGGHEHLLSLAKQIPQTNQNTTRDGFTFFLHSVDDPINFRNSGPFFEPGRFSIVICIAIIINLSLKKSLFDLHNIILILAIISTFSTTGYLSLLIILFSFALINVKKTFYRVILASIFIIVTIYIFKFDFLFDKITTQAKDIDNSNSRFGALYYLIDQIKQSPWFGYGNSLNFVVDGSISSPNGLGEIVRWWGIPFSLIYFILLFRGAKLLVIDKKWHITSFICLLLLAFSQSITLAPLYYVICFMGLVVVHDKNKKAISLIENK